MSRCFILPFESIRESDLTTVGGKNIGLGALTRDLADFPIGVSPGFAITADAFRRHLSLHRLEAHIHEQLDALDVRDVPALERAGRIIRTSIESRDLPADVVAEILAAYRALCDASGDPALDVAVRSSATAEDLPEASFAGQQESFLGIRGEAALLRAVRACMASLYTDRAIVYRTEHGFAHRDIALSVGVQRMVRSDLACSGVLFTLDTETGFRNVVLIAGSWGLGESVVQGRVNPDEIWVHKPTLARGFRPIVRRELGDKKSKIVYASGGMAATTEVRVPEVDRTRFVLSDDEVLLLARAGVRLEERTSARTGRDTPMDIEWAKDGRSGELFIVQARAETVHSRKSGQRLESFRLKGKGTLLTRGKSVGARIGAGMTRVVRSAADLANVRPGEVLVAPMTDPDWEPVLSRAAAIVTDQGGRTCHAAIVSRELGLPCVVGTGDATRVLADPAEVTVSCAEGDEGRVYSGRIPFARVEVDPSTLPRPRVPVMLNVGSPETAFRVAQLPSAGVGLARIEFIVSSWIGIHPMALLHPERVDEATRSVIRARTAIAASPSEFFVERLASGIAQIGAAFHPRPVIVRFSDFKTNEYANLIGGAAFEPTESNPMIGFRGASRYYDPRYREAFALECAAIRRVREEMGLVNVKVMIPFCRTLGEGRAVLDEMGKNSLRRGDAGLEVWVMCEIPNNVVLAAEFCELFDGFSIGSNDLTQLTLGIDRDSEILAPIFDEQDPGVKRLIASVIRDAHACGRRVSLCGQAPSDHPEFADFLANAGIDSISVTPDALPSVVSRLATERGSGGGGADLLPTPSTP